MLLEHEKNGTGSKRMARATAFLEAAGILDRLASVDRRGYKRDWLEELSKAADMMRDKAVEERKAHDAQNRS